jgi:hypothetical protein
MAQRPLDPSVADEAPHATALTGYDEQHAITYLRLLDAEAEGADWTEVARVENCCVYRALMFISVSLAVFILAEFLVGVLVAYPVRSRNSCCAATVPNRYQLGAVSEGDNIIVIR